MTSSKKQDTSAVEFFAELTRTLDMGLTLKKLGMAEEEARVLLEGVVSRLTPVTPQPGKAAKAGGRGVSADSVVAYVDGGSRGNPGKAGAGAVVLDRDGNVISRRKKALGIATNNVAEYSSLVMALKEARSLGAKAVEVFADSELMVKQVNGVYKVRSEGLKPLYNEVKRLQRGFEAFKISHIPRDKNKDADALANEAMDGL